MRKNLIKNSCHGLVSSTIHANMECNYLLPIDILKKKGQEEGVGLSSKPAEKKKGLDVDGLNKTKRMWNLWRKKK
jgi:hypothetical protein